MKSRLTNLIGNKVTLINLDQETNEVIYHQTGTITDLDIPSCFVYILTDANETIRVHFNFLVHTAIEGWIRSRIAGHLISLAKQQQAAIDDRIHHVIYALIDPRDNSIRYIGMTRNAKERYKQHIHLSGTNERKNAWIQELQSLSLQPQLAIIEKITGKRAALERERYLISYYQSQGFPLTN